ncbi:head GIN domain-containing protein [Mucilaginibacter pedocola]|nr:head GIN domain-containing protein [Mucilaginibacter pedocola]
MKKSYLQIFVLVAVLSASLLSSSCRRFKRVHGSGKTATERRTVVEFDRVDISGGLNATLVQDSSSVVTVTADDNLMKYIKTEVEGHELRIYTTRNLQSDIKITVNIGFKQLEQLGASGAVEVASIGRINTGDFNMDLSGSTHVDLDLAAADVRTECSGASEIKLKGQAASHRLALSGSSDIYAFDFVVGKYQIESSGASHCRINVLKDLSVQSSGASETEYRGSPSRVSSSKSGAASLTKVN